MRKKIVAANWKMNKNMQDGIQLAVAITQQLSTVEDDQLVILCTPYIHLTHVAELLKEKENYSAGAQNCHDEESGAYTGEISAEMIASTGVEYVIIGHSERREFFGEKSDELHQKLLRALEEDLNPIFCIGEKLKERKSGKHKDTVKKQLEESLFLLNEEKIKSVILAYEPVWAIGTGEVATPAQAQEMHKYIRSLIAEHYGKEVAENISILYGGSVKPDNAGDIFSQKDVDGGLIGGASLKADDFVAICNSF